MSSLHQHFIGENVEVRSTGQLWVPATILTLKPSIRVGLEDASEVVVASVDRIRPKTLLPGSKADTVSDTNNNSSRSAASTSADYLPTRQDDDGLPNAPIGPPTRGYLELFFEWWAANGPIRSTPEGDQVYVSGWFVLLFTLSASVLISCLASSFHYVNYNEYGLKRNNYGSIYLKPTLERGRYFYPLSFGVVYFPSTYQAVDFKSSVFADNGMEFDLHVRFYYRMPKEKVGDIYNRYSKNYHSRVENNGKNVIKNVGTQFKVHNYLANRSYIEHVIAQNISSDLESVIGVQVPLEYVKITNIKFPPSLIAISLDSALALQTNELQILQQEVALVKSQTEQIVAQVDAAATLLLTNTDNKCKQIIDTASEEAKKIVYTSRSFYMARMFQNLGINSTEAREQLIRTMAVYDSEAYSTTLMYEIQGGAFVNV